LVFCYRCLGNGGAYSSPNPPEITGVVGWGKVGVSAAGAARLWVFEGDREMVTVKKKFKSWIGPDPITQTKIQRTLFFTRNTLYIIFSFTMSYGFYQSQIL
jgi:hypothetical protein